MLNKTPITLAIFITLTIIATTMNSSAIARGGGGGGGGGGMGGSGGHFSPARFDHTRFDHTRFDRRFLRNQVLLDGWGWGWPYGEGGYSNTNVVVYPQAIPQMANATGSVAPCHWNAETFTVPSSGGGTRPVEVVGCR